MTDKQRLVVGGDIERNLKGEYAFNISNVFKEAWGYTQTYKWLFLQMGAIIVALAFLMVSVLLGVFGIDDIREIPLNVQVTIDLIITVIFAPLTTAMIAVAATHTVGGKGRVSHLFSLLPRMAILGLASLMVSLLIQIGVSLFIVPGLYLLMATTFTLLLVAEKKMTGMQAMILSIKMVNTYLVDFIKVYILLALMFATAIFTFGITLIWVAPMYYHVKGVLYRDLFGITVYTKLQDGEQAREESIFHA